MFIIRLRAIFSSLFIAWILVRFVLPHFWLHLSVVFHDRYVIKTFKTACILFGGARKTRPTSTRCTSQVPRYNYLLLMFDKQKLYGNGPTINWPRLKFTIALWSWDLHRVGVGVGELLSVHSLKWNPNDVLITCKVISNSLAIQRRKMSDWSSRDHVTLPHSKWRQYLHSLFIPVERRLIAA